MNFKKLVEKIDLEEFIRSEGYRLDKRKSTKAQRVYKKRDNGSTVDAVIVMAHRNTKEIFYKNTDIPEDTGNVVTFLMNRMGGGSIIQNHQKNDYLTVSKRLHDYLNLSPDQKYNLIKEDDAALNELKKSAAKEEPFNYHLYNTSELKHFDSLTNRGVDEKILFSPLFKNRIVQAYAYDHKKEKNYTVPNIGFPFYKKGEIVGLEMRNTDFKSFGNNSEKTNSIWLSNIPKNPICFFVGESPIDSLSHNQLKNQKGAFYGATGGNMADGQIHEILRVAKDAGVHRIASITDNDISGSKYDFRIMCALDMKKQIHVLENAKKYITVEIRTDEEGLGKKDIPELMSHLSNYNKHQESLLKKHSDDETYLRKFLGGQKDNGLRVKIPTTIHAHNFFNEIVSKYLKLEINLEFDKSKANDWNQDLKDSLGIEDDKKLKEEKKAYQKR